MTSEELETLKKNLAKRQMAVDSFDNVKELKEFLASYLKENATIGFGGSMTFEKDTGLYQELKESKKYHFLDRYAFKTEEEIKMLNALTINADYFFLSCNGLSLDGELVNIDGRGNRLCYLMYGPKEVMVIVGKNKIEKDLSSAYQRVRDIASPKNAVRLKKNTPCAIKGNCMDCLSPDCICSNIVVTRRSHIRNRIHILLVNEDLGY